MECSFIKIYDFLLENPRWLESKNFFGQGKCPPSQKEGPRGVPGSATSNEGDQRRRGVGAAWARRGRWRGPWLPGETISKDNLTNRPALRRSDTPWARGPANSNSFVSDSIFCSYKDKLVLWAWNLARHKTLIITNQVEIVLWGYVSITSGKICFFVISLIILCAFSFSV